jgi:hypothetical protein
MSDLQIGFRRSQYVLYGGENQSGNYELARMTAVASWQSTAAMALSFSTRSMAAQTNGWRIVAVKGTLHNPAPAHGRSAAPPAGEGQRY